MTTQQIHPQKILYDENPRPISWYMFYSYCHHMLPSSISPQQTPPTLMIRGMEANFALPKGKSLSLFILSDDNLSLLLRWKVDSAWASRFSLDLYIYKAE